jgi:hypothetical protein
VEAPRDEDDGHRYSRRAHRVLRATRLRAHGFKKPFPYGDERFGIPKRDDLRFEVLEKSLQ